MTAGNYYCNIIDNVYFNLHSPNLLKFVITFDGKFHILCLKKPFLDLTNVSNFSVNHLMDLANNAHIVHYYKDLDLRAFTYLIVKESFHLDIMLKWYPDINSIIEQESEKICNFSVFGEISERARLEHVIKKGSDLVESLDFDCLLYGKIILAEHLAKGRPNAAYNPENDLIKFAKKMTYTKNYRRGSIKSFLHELGHRAVEKNFIDRNTCLDMYNEIKKSQEKYIQWIPSKYSLSRFREWFPEIFSHGLTKDIKIYKDFVKAVHKDFVKESKE